MNNTYFRQCIFFYARTWSEDMSSISDWYEKPKVVASRISPRLSWLSAAGSLAISVHLRPKKCGSSITNRKRRENNERFWNEIMPVNRCDPRRFVPKCWDSTSKPMKTIEMRNNGRGNHEFIEGWRMQMETDQSWWGIWSAMQMKVGLPVSTIRSVMCAVRSKPLNRTAA